MRTTGEFVIHRYDIPIKKWGEPIYLIPFGDVHRDANVCHVDKWLEFLEWAKKKKPCYFIGMGDYFDFASSSERDILANPKLHDTTQNRLSKVMKESVREFAHEISFMRGKLIGMICGNHYGVLRNKEDNGLTTDEKLCQMMGTKYLGSTAFIQLVFAGDRHNSKCAIDIWAHHGSSACSTLGGSINSVEKMQNVAIADIYMLAHDHKRFAVPTSPKLFLRNGHSGLPTLHHKKRLLVRTGSFMRGYVDGEISYISEKSLPPSDLGVVKIEMTRRRIQSDG